MQNKVFEFEKASFLGAHENGSPEWHELRKGAVGGSQVGTILGVNPWESAVTAFYKATGAIDDHIEPSMSMRLGTKLEDDILEVFSEEHPELKVFTTGTYASKAVAWQHANPDGIYEKADGTLGVIEIKFSRDYWSDVPPSYRKQVLWYMHVLGLDEAYIVALAGSAYQEFTIMRDQFEIDAMVQAVERFYSYVQNNVQPDWDGSESTYDTMRKVYSDMLDEEEDLGDLGMHLALAHDELKSAESKFRELQSRTLEALGNKKHGQVEGIRVVSKQQTKTGVPFLKMKGK